jgi:hypothetical protein
MALIFGGTMSTDMACDLDVYKHGELIGVYDMPKAEAEELRKKLTKETGRLHDWHYFGGRVVMKALPEGFVPESHKPENPWA